MCLVAVPVLEHDRRPSVRPYAPASFERGWGALDGGLRAAAYWGGGLLTLPLGCECECMPVSEKLVQFWPKKCTW